jgi:hypothetical protein
MITPHKTNAGDWKVESEANSHPVWTTISHAGKAICRVRHDELRDLEYCLGRIRTMIKADLPAGYKHEVD